MTLQQTMNRNLALPMAEYLSIRSNISGISGILLHTADNVSQLSGTCNIHTIASMLTITPLQVVNSLIAMQEYGLIELEHGRIIIKDRNSLYKITQLPCAAPGNPTL